MISMVVIVRDTVSGPGAVAATWLPTIAMVSAMVPPASRLPVSRVGMVQAVVIMMALMVGMPVIRVAVIIPPVHV